MRKPKKRKTKDVCQGCGAPEVTDGIVSNLSPYSRRCIKCLFPIATGEQYSTYLQRLERQ